MTGPVSPKAIGECLPRDRARRAVAGQGRYTDDLRLPRMAHAAFLRSPHAHARIRGFDLAEAMAVPGVIAIFTGADLEEVLPPYAAPHGQFPTLRAPDQRALPIERTLWCGEALALVVAVSRAVAEDAVERIAADLEPLPPIASIEAALDPNGPALHPAIGGNVGLDLAEGNAAPGSADGDGAVVVEATFAFGRHTAATLETRTIVADWRSAEGVLEVHQSHQCPHQQQDIYARLLGLPQHAVRVICGDVGGAFGMKQQLYGDELAVCAASRLLDRPVKFVADRLESFVSDTHAREHSVTARLSATPEGRLVGLEVDDRFGAGAYSQYPRSSVGEGAHVLRLSGAAYRLDRYAGRLRLAYQNKPLVGHYRSVGHPIACAVTEALVDRMAERLALDPAELRRRNYVRTDDLPHTTPAGVVLDQVSLAECQTRLEQLVDYPRLRREQQALRRRGIHRGLGLAAVVELTATGPGYYGGGGVRVSAQDGVTVRLEPDGSVRAATSLTDQGQGIDTGLQQVIAETLGVEAARVRVDSGDSATTPSGGGAWASRGASVGGEAALRAARRLKRQILDLAAALLQGRPDSLDLRAGVVVDAGGTARLPFDDLAAVAHFRQHELPPGVQPELAATAFFVPRERPYIAANGVQFSHVEVDVETGVVRLLDHAVVHDSGRLLNPMLAEEQIRGGVVQGIGAALFEELRYEDGQLTNGSFADYLVPMAAEMPDIRIAHLETPDSSTELGARGVGEAGVAGASAAVLNAVNDALSALTDRRLCRLPITPARLLAVAWGPQD